MSKRRKGRAGLIAGLLAVVALVVTAAVLWRWSSPSTERTALPATPASVSTPAHPPARAGEDFSTAERQRLEDILRRKSAGEQR